MADLGTPTAGERRPLPGNVHHLILIPGLAVLIDRYRGKCVIFLDRGAHCRECLSMDKGGEPTSSEQKILAAEKSHDAHHSQEAVWDPSKICLSCTTVLSPEEVQKSSCLSLSKLQVKEEALCKRYLVSHDVSHEVA
ncbi:hypothetical protein EDD18DRAFT_1108656 [Armillaria luteobubalina]|uniref:Uncharacterized protein n=1 Tax=Armillaria luteobubalina TaxID=153913 RepID=A0AA39PY89_9AGAR|nr:hypothetical protein EDD18DRAFT_1108656 [Armillaria luteobubalina]